MPFTHLCRIGKHFCSPFSVVTDSTVADSGAAGSPVTG
jgi:hypothetical protein